MRGFTQRQNATRPPSSATSATSARSAKGPTSLAHSASRSTDGGGVAEGILQLQRTVGNQAVARLLQGPSTGDQTPSATARTRLTVNTPGDTREQEADRSAERATARPSPAAGSGVPLTMQRVAAPSNGQAGTAPGSVEQTLAGPGRPLDAELRRDMEQRLGHDFSRVRVHSGASAEQSARDVAAAAYTVGHHVVFGRSRFAPQTQEGRRLIAHELTHVVQQSRSPSMFHTPSAPAVVQRKEEDPARAKVVKAMDALKAKWGLGSVTEENGAKWSEAELRRVDAAFSIMAKDDQALLKGMHLVRTDKFDPLVIEEKTTQKDPKKKKKPKTFPIAGETIGNTIRLAGNAFRGRATTILHEAGHLIHNKVAAAMLAKSRPKLDLDAARTALTAAQKKTPRASGAEQVALAAAMNKIISAAGDLELSNKETRAAKQSALDNLKPEAGMARSQLEMAPQDANTTAILQFHDALEVFVEAVEKFVEERDKQNLTEFVDIVNKHKLAQRKFAPFTEYVAAHWPHKPGEYFAEAFRAWRTDRDYMKNNMKPLFDWFEKGGHRVK